MSREEVAALMADPRLRNNPEYMRRAMSDQRFVDPNTKENFVLTYLNTEPQNSLNMYGTYNDRSNAIGNYYDEQLASTRAKAGSQATADAADYQTTIDELNRNLKQDTSTLADTEGQKGTFGSSARAERMGSLVGKYNTSYQDAYNKAVNTANQFGVNQQSLLGDTFSPMDIKKYTASPEGTTSTSGMYKYNPFKQLSGSIQANRAYSLKGLQTGK